MAIDESGSAQLMLYGPLHKDIKAISRMQTSATAYNGYQRRRQPAIALGLFVLLASSGALACRGPQLEQITLHSSLHPLMFESAFIAKVEVIGVKTDWEASSLNGRKNEIITGEARVIKVVKGGDVGQIIKINATPTSCGGALYDEDIGKQAYIAGLISNGLFSSGRWFPLKFDYYWESIAP